MPEFPEFPKFPTTYTEKDVEQLKRLEEKRKVIEAVYKGHFAPGKWALKPAWEVSARKVAEAAYVPGWAGRGLARIWESITPWTEVGFTPEQADVIKQEMEAELRDLRRRELIVERLPKIKSYMETLALLGKLTGEEAQLYLLMPELDPSRAAGLELDEEERNWLLEYNRLLAGATREGLLEGIPFPSPETYDELMEQFEVLAPHAPHDPRQAFATVSFIKDYEEIAKAIKAMYPAKEGERTPEELAQDDVWKEMWERGIAPTGDIEKDIKLLEESIIGERIEEGEPYVHITEDGTAIPLTRKEDGIYSNGAKIANVDPDTGKAIPLTEAEEYEISNAPPSGDRVVSESLLRSVCPGVSDSDVESFFATGVGDVELWYEKYRTRFTTPMVKLDWVLEKLIEIRTGAYPPPNFIMESLSAWRAGVGDVIVTSGGAARWLGADGIAETLTREGNKLQSLAFPDDLGDFHWKLLLNPRFWALRGTRIVPFTLSLLPAAVGGYYAGAAIGGAAAVKIGLGVFGTKVLVATSAGIGGAIASRPIESAMEAGAAYDRAKSMGATDEEADAIANEVFINNLKLVGLDAVQIAVAFAPVSLKAGANLITRGLVNVTRIGGRMFIVGLTEAGEEAYQEVITRQALGEEVKLDAEMQQVMALGGAMGLGMGAGGDVLSGIINQTKDSMTPTQKKKFEADVEEAGEAAALDNFAETPEGAKLVEQVVEVVEEQQFNREIKETKVAPEAGEAVAPVAPEIIAIFKQTTDVPFYDIFLKDPIYAKSKGYETRIVQMSPDEYIRQSAKIQGTNIARQIAMVQQDLVDKYAESMLEGTKFDMPYFDFRLGSQEGRARVLAAKKLGYNRVPVLIATESGKLDTTIARILTTKSVTKAPAVGMPEEGIYRKGDVFTSPEGEMKLDFWVASERKWQVTKPDGTQVRMTLEEIDRLVDEGKWKYIPMEVPILPEVGIPMPIAAQQEILTQFGEGNPGFSTEPGGLIYRNPEGKPIAAVTLSYGPSGAVRVGSVVNTATGLLKGKATAAFLKELKTIDNLVMPDVSEMSPEGLAIFKKYQEAKPTAPKIVFESVAEAEAVAIRAFNKMKATVGMGGRAPLTNAEVEALRLYVNEHGVLDDRFLGVAEITWTGDLEIILGVFPEKMSPITGGRYLAYNTKGNTFGVHSTPPSLDETVKFPETGRTIRGQLTADEWESGVKDWLAGRIPFPIGEEGLKMLAAPAVEAKPPVRKKIHTKEIKFYQNQLAVIEGEITTTRKSLETHSKRLESLKEAKALPYELTELQGTIKKLEADLSELNTQRDTLRTKIETLGKVVVPKVGVPMTLVAYRRGAREGAIGAGTFYLLEGAPFPEGLDKGVRNELTFKNVLELSEEELGIYAGLPAEALANRWFPRYDFQGEATKLGLEDGELIDRMVAEEAVRRGYDAVKYGDRELQDLRGVGIKPIETPQTRWDAQSLLERVTSASKAGIAKVAAKLSWSELTSVQQERLEASEVKEPVITKETVEKLSPEELSEGKAIDKKVAEAQSRSLGGLPERTVDVGVLEQLREAAEEYFDKQLYGADMDNDLSKAMVAAYKLGDIPTFGKYLDKLPKKETGGVDWDATISQEFKDAEFDDASMWNLNSMPFVDACAYIDKGRFGRPLRMKVYQIGDQAQMANYGFQGGWGRKLLDIKRTLGLDKPSWWKFRRKAAWNEMSYAVVDELSLEDTTVDADELLQREEISKPIKEFSEKYPLSSEQQLVIIEYARFMRMSFDEIWAELNSIGVILGLEPVGYIRHYLPEVYKTNVWGRFLGIHLKPDFLHEQALAPDFIKPSAPFNPRVLERKGGLAGYEKVKDVDRLFLDYVAVAGRQIFFTPAINNAKAHARYLRNEKGLDVPAKYIEDRFMETLAGVPDSLSRWAKEAIPPWIMNPLWAVRRRLNPAVFGLNPAWNLFIQTSSMALLPLKGVRTSSCIKGLQYIWNPAARTWVEDNVPASIIKERGRGSIVHQDVGTTLTEARRADMSPLETVDEWVTFITRKLERLLTGISAYAGHAEGQRRGITDPAKLVAFASDVATTQSMYDPFHMPGAYSPMIRLPIPFQTFLFEALTKIREMSGIKKIAAGAYVTVAADSAEGKSLIRKRAKYFLEFMAAIFLINVVGELFNQRKPWEWSSFVPACNIMMYGVDPSNPWNKPFLSQYAIGLWKGFDAIIGYGNWKPLTYWATKWHFPAGFQAKKMIEGVVATIEGAHTDVSGEVMFELEEEEWLKAVTLGVWSTESGQEWIKTHMEGESPTTQRILKDIEKLGEQLGTSIEGKYYTLSKYKTGAINLIRENKPDEPLWRILESAPIYPPLTLFAMHCEIIWEEYYDTPGGERIAYRKANPYIDATLVFWEQVQNPRSAKGKEELGELFKIFGVDKNLRWHYKGLPEIPEEFVGIPE